MADLEKSFRILNNKKFIFRNKKQLNILSLKSIKNNLKKFKPVAISFSWLIKANENS